MKDKWLEYALVAGFAALGAFMGYRWKTSVLWAAIGGAAGAMVGEILDDWID